MSSRLGKQGDYDSLGSNYKSVTSNYRSVGSNYISMTSVSGFELCL